MTPSKKNGSGATGAAKSKKTSTSASKKAASKSSTKKAPASPASPRRLYDESVAVKENARDFHDSLNQMADDAWETVFSNLENHPYRTLGIAAGIGFVLAGGLASTLARHAVGYGLRTAIHRYGADVLFPPTDG
ncbi:hypothetical protein KDL45_17325 [bacterium]|nr:hypothetical protein [bacterium]